MKKKKRIIFRVSPFNRLSFPVLLNVWEQEKIDGEFEILIRFWPLDPCEVRGGDVILFSFMTSVFPLIHEEVRRIKSSARKDVLLACGGPHVTGDGELPYEAGFDVLFRGPAERNFLKFALDLLDDRPLPRKYEYEEDGCQEAAGGDDFNSYIPVSRYFETVPPLEIMRGCYWNCSYCGTHLHRVRFRTMESIETHLVEMKRRDFKRVNFVSPSAMEYGASAGRKIDLDRIEALLAMIDSHGFLFNEYGIFPSEVRPDTVTPEGMELLKRYVINKSITIGAQSGQDERLRQLRRGHLTADTRQAIAIANDAGFLVNLDFIVGYPDETPEERKTMLEFIKDLSRNHRIRIHIHHFIPLSGSPYAYRFPAFLTEEDKNRLVELKKAGIASDGWIANEKQALDYFAWLKKYFPGYYSRYS